MKKTFLILLAVLLTVSISAQNQKPVYSSNQGLSYDKFISGVKYASIGLNAPSQEMVDKNVGMAGFYYIAQKYLFELGFEYVALTSAQKTELEIEVNSYCDYAQVIFGGDVEKNAISNMTMTFITCNGDVFTFSSDKKFTFRKFRDIEKNLVENWKTMISTKANYQEQNRLKLPSNQTDWSREKITEYLEDNKGKLDHVEGIYERVRMSLEDLTGGKYTVGIVKDTQRGGYLVIYLSGATNSFDWKHGEVKATLEKTATPGFYSVNWITRDKSLYNDVYCSLDPMGFSIISSGVVELAYKFIKLLPVQEKPLSNKYIQSYHTNF